MVNQPNIDWDFIRKLEGFELKGYIPKDRDKNNKTPSGVTVACGFDLGQHNSNDLLQMQLKGDLVLKLALYTGITGDKAAKVLKEHPLILTKDEGVEVDNAVKRLHQDRVIDEYNANSELNFTSLPRACQTVIMSVAFQYGSLKKKTPNFFKSVTEGDWQKAYNQLMNFGDSYKTRRQTEADYLSQVLPVA